MPMLMQPNAALFSTGEAFGFSLLGMFGAPLTSSTAMPTTDAASAFSALFAQMTQNLGQPIEAAEALANNEAMVQSAAAEDEADITDQALASIQQTIQIVYDEMTRISEGGIDLGSIGSAKDLAFAYRQMGMDPEEAARRAIQLTTVMAILDQRLQSGADMSAAVVDPGLLLQVQDMMSEDEAMRTTALSTRSLSVFAGIALTASIDGNLANRILNGENLSQDLGSIVTRTLQALGVPAQADGAILDEAALIEMVDNGSFDDMMQNAAPVANAATAAVAARPTLVEALARLNAKAEQPLTDAELAKAVAAAGRMVADARIGGAHAIDREVMAQLEATAPAQAKTPVVEGVIPAPAVAEGLAQSAAKAADAAKRVRTEITQTIESQPIVEDVVTQASPKAGSTAERAAPPPASPHAAQGDNNNIAASHLHSTKVDVPAVQAQPVMVIESAPGGGYQVVDAQTGEVMNVVPQSAPTNRAEVAEQLNNVLVQYRASQQINVHFRTLARHGGGNITVSLTPPELGRLDVHLRIRDNKVEGTITVQKSDVLEHLARDLKGLEQALQDLGLELGKGGLNLQLAQQDAGSSQETADEAKRHFMRESIVKANAVDVPQGQGIWLSPDRLMDILV